MQKSSATLTGMLRSFAPTRVVARAIRGFLYEYMTNHVVAHVPVSRLRWVWYRFFLGFPMDFCAYIHLGVYVYPSIDGTISMGKYTAVNRGVVLDGRGGLFIGENVNISAEAAIYTGGHLIDDEDFSYYDKPVTIEDHVWIGTRAMIMPGVTIGKGAVVLPGAVVTHDIKQYEIWGGVPARFVRKRTSPMEYDMTWRGYFI